MLLGLCFQGEPSQEKTRTESEAATSAQVSEIIPSGIEEQEEEDEEEEAVPALYPRGLRDRGPAVLER